LRKRRELSADFLKNFLDGSTDNSALFDFASAAIDLVSPSICGVGEAHI
jgi:hypothetical protein